MKTKVHMMYINGVAWKYYGAHPTTIQKQVESGSFRRTNGLSSTDELNVVVKEELI